MGNRSRIMLRAVITVALILIFRTLTLDAAKILDNEVTNGNASVTQRGEDILGEKLHAVSSSSNDRIAFADQNEYHRHQFVSKILQNNDSEEVVMVQTKSNFSRLNDNKQLKALNNREPQSNFVSSMRNLKNHDLHTAFQLPLQRLSDLQLLTLLQRYNRKVNGEIFEKMSRAKKIERLQKLIENGSGRLNLIRPTLLTNVNVLNTEESVPSPKSFSVHRENSVKTGYNIGEKRQKHIPELMDDGRREEDALSITENNSEVSADIPVNSRELSTLERMLIQAKARYETVKRIFAAKLQELHEKKMRMTEKLFTATSTTSLAELQTTIESNFSEIMNNDSILEKTNLKGEYIALQESITVLPESTTIDDIETLPSGHRDTSEIKHSSDESSPTEAHNPLKYGLQSKPHTIESSLEVKVAIKAELEETEKTTAKAEENTQTTNWDWEEEAQLKYSTATTETNVEEQLPISSSVEPNAGLEPLEAVSSENIDPFLSQQDSSKPYNAETASSDAATAQSSINIDQEKTTTESLLPERTTKIASDIVEDEKRRSITTNVQNEELHHPAELDKVGENRLIRKLLGIIQYATKSVKQPATSSTSSTIFKVHNSSTELSKLHDSSAEEKKQVAEKIKILQMKMNHKISTTQNKPINHKSLPDVIHVEKLIKYPAPRAQQLPKLFFVASQNNNRSPSNAEEDTPERAEIITPHRTHGSDEIRNFTMKTSREKYVSAAELIVNLKKEWKTQIYGSTNPNDKSSQSSLAVDKHELEDVTQTNKAICSATACDFEQGDLCQWVASVDELMPGDRQYRYRFRNRRMRRGSMRYNMERRSLLANRVLQRRQTGVESKNFVQRTWHNWEGRYRNRLTGIARAQIFSYSNRRFAAAYVKPNQRATLSTSLLSGQRETIRFRAWEATRDLRLRVCCDTIDNGEGGPCVFETDRGVRHGSRNWKEYTATCPQGTQKIIFECVNDGLFQGACGIDNVHLLNEYCPQIIPLVGLLDNNRN